jgi:glycosyltransferase involved in cell wall biosynthesis
MQITFVLPGWARKPSGGFKVVYEYANHLSERGHKIRIIHSLLTFPKEVSFKKKIAAPVILTTDHLFGFPKVSWFDISPKVDIIIVKNLEEKFIPEGDIIVAAGWQTAEFVAHYTSSKGRKFYLVMDFYPWLGPRDRIEATWRMLFNKITISHWLYEKVLKTTNCKNDLISIPPGINQKKYNLIEDVNQRGDRISMMYSRGSYKVPEDGISALEICKAKFPALNITLFGPFRPIKAFPSWMVFRRNVSEEDLARLYNSSKIHVCCSLEEGFAFPPAEAMACGCAIVSTDCGGIREYAKHGITALLSPPRDPKGLAQNIIRLLENDELRVKLAKAGYEKIQDFTWQKAVTKLEEAFGQNNVSI